PFETVRIAAGWGRVRSGRFGLERGAAPAIKIVDRITDTLIIASEGASNRGGMLPFGTREEDMAPTNGKTSGGSQPSFQCCPFVGHQRSNKKWCLHRGEDTTWPITLSGNALDHLRCYMPWRPASPEPLTYEC